MAQGQSEVMASRQSDRGLAVSPAVARAGLLGVGTAVSPQSFSQEEVLELFEVTDPRVRSLFANSGIERRNLTLPGGSSGTRRAETQGELLAKHLEVGLQMGADAIESCLAGIGATVGDIDHLCCVSSTGFMTPGFSARLINELGISTSCSRLDVVGMGCNAGLNALGAVAAWAQCHPQKLAVMACIEVCSAAYVFDGTMRSAVVNSLFGDGAAALAVVGEEWSEPCPRVLRFESHLIPEAIDAMRFDWDDDQGRFSFFLDPEIPYVVGANAETVIDRVLEGTGLCPADIQHWVIHSGGKKVIESVRVNLGLTRHDLRHTTSVLRDHGNLSSASFLFSWQRLLREGVARAGDYGILMTMGPGSTIETALLRWPGRGGAGSPWTSSATVSSLAVGDAAHAV